MLAIIFTVFFGILIAFFAVQNRNYVDLRFGEYLLTGIPVYLVVLGSVLLTLLFSGLLYLINSVTSSFHLFSKNKSIKHEHQENEKLTRRIQELEVENAKFKERENYAEKRPIFSS